jgi:hypothetical protein
MPKIAAFDREKSELDSVLSSWILERAPSLAHLLTYVCSKYFDGASEQIKEYNIAVEALGRPPDFDQKKDSIVRVEAHKLRKRLREYYKSEGADHPVRIEIPPGQYVPKFIFQHAPAQDAARTIATCWSDVPNEGVLMQLTRILKSPYFQPSDPCSLFLRHIMEHAGANSECLEERTLGVEIFARDPDYDTKQDPIVRTTAGKVRKRLDRYYMEPAHEQELRITLPVDSYMPEARFPAGESTCAPSLPVEPEEVPGAGVRILDPPQTTAEPEEDAPNETTMPAPSSGANRAIRYAAGGFGLGALVGVLCLLWFGSVRERRLAMAMPDSKVAIGNWTPALQSVWGPLLDEGTPVLIAFETRLFLKAGQLLVRDPKVDDANKVESSEELMRVKRLFDVPQLSESTNYSDSGATQTVFLLARLLGTRRVSISMKRSGDVTADDLRRNHLIFVGKPTADPSIRSILARGAIIDHGGRIQISDPLPGELPVYVDQFDPLSPDRWSEKYAVISMMPGAEPGKRILILAGVGSEHPWALAEYLTNPRHAEEMVNRLRLPSGRLPDFYQVLVKAEFRSQAPVQMSYVTHRVFEHR